MNLFRSTAFVFAPLLVLGLLIAVLLPPLQGPDEPAHWRTALTRAPFSQRQLCTTDKALPELFQFDRIVWHPEQKFSLSLFSHPRIEPRCEVEEVSYSNWFSYPSVQLSRLLTSPFPDSPWTSILKYYLARLLGGFCFLFALAKLYQRRPTLLLVAFASSPLLLQQVFTVSGDTVILLYLALSFAMGEDVFEKKWSQQLATAGLALLAAGCIANKPTLAPVFCTLAIFEWLKGRRSLATMHFAVCAAMVLAPLLNHATFKAVTAGTVDPAAQLQFVFDHLWGTFRALWRVVRSAINPNTWTGPLGFLEAPLAAIYVYSWSLAMLSAIGVSLYQNSKHAALPSLLGGLAILGTGFLSALAMYLIYTPVGLHEVHGMQSRYVFPALFAAFYFLPTIKTVRWYALMPIFGSIAVAWGLLERFWWT